MTSPELPKNFKELLRKRKQYLQLSLAINLGVGNFAVDLQNYRSFRGKMMMEHLIQVL